MTSHTVRDTPAPAPMLRWVLQRNEQAITCELDARGTRSYEVCIVPHWNLSAAVIERFDAPTPALLRHAEVSRRLGESGWKVVDHVGAGTHAKRPQPASVDAVQGPGRRPAA
jgi:hypothetical protein